eukprot:m.281016 g.281016  ORF g.281016 m.281016 type:complete len:182 (-) comp16326_c0_seq2:393-938(-)
MSQLRHPNIVLFFGAGQDDEGGPFIVSEFLTRGTLRAVLANQTKYRSLSWSLRVNMCLDVAAGMAFLHSRKPQMLHRDLKSDNILLDERFTAKVADFGSIKTTVFNQGLIKPTRTATMDDNTSSITATLGVGTPLWTAPEVVLATNFFVLFYFLFMIFKMFFSMHIGQSGQVWNRSIWSPR